MMSVSGEGRPCTFRNASVLYAQIVDGSGHVVGNQATLIPVTLDGLPHTIERPLEAIAAEAVAGSSYRLQITPATTLCTPQRSIGAVTFGRIEESSRFRSSGRRRPARHQRGSGGVSPRVPSSKTSSGRAAETSALG